MSTSCDVQKQTKNYNAQSNLPHITENKLHANVLRWPQTTHSDKQSERENSRNTQKKPPKNMLYVLFAYLY